MFALKPLASVLVAIMVIASVVPAAAATQSGGSTQAYAGTHVTFDAESTAVTDYAVDGQAMLSAVKVQSADEAERRGLLDAGVSLSAVTSLEGAGLSVAAESDTQADIDVEGTASMTAHDNGNGILVVRAGGDEQYVTANLSSGAEAASTGDGRVSVTTADGVEGTFIVVGDGRATVNDDGDVAAELGGDGRLVFRAYPDGRSESAETHERLIADGTAVAEVHVMAEDDGTVTDTVSYADGTAVRAGQSAQGRVEVTVDRAAHRGKIVVTKVSESALNAGNGVAVAVDGEAAAEASSYSELEGAIGSDQSKYLVRGASSASASSEVLVAVNHFSERTITMSEGGSDEPTDSDGSTGGDGSASDGDADSDGSSDPDGGSSDPVSAPGQPGFGVGIAVAALLAAAFIAVRRP